MKEVKKKIERLKREKTENDGNELLTTAAGKKQLEEIQKKYVLVSADKSENNVIVVCKKYYVERVRKELAGIEGKAKTYERQEERIEQTVSWQVEQIEKKYGLKVEEAMKTLATLYWTAKMHYDPPRERFIAASSKCATKVLSQLLSKCLKLVQNQLKGECEKERRDSKSKASRYWIVDSTEETVAKIDRVNRRKQPRQSAATTLRHSTRT